MNADVKVAEKYLETLDKLIVGKNYLPEQIFHMNEIFLLCQQMPQSTFIYREHKSMPGFKACKGMISLGWG